MIRRILLTTVTLSACIAGMTMGSASAAPPTTCTLAPVSGSQNAQGGFDDRRYRFMAMWMATAGCEDPNHPFDGETVPVQQMAAVSPQGSGSVIGPTRLGLGDVNDDDRLDLVVSGDVSGPAACNATTCMLNLEIRASGRCSFPMCGGVRLSGSEMLTFDRASGDVLSFTPGTLLMLNNKYPENMS